MKRSVLNRIPTLVLWVCMLITLCLSVWFYWIYIAQSDSVDSIEISALLNWLFILSFITLFTTLILAAVYFIRQWKRNPRKMKQSVTGVAALILLFLTAFLLGNGNPLPLIGYKGSENTYGWLKLTDMWLYSIYILLILGFFSLIGGIVWSYFKKVK